MPIVPTWRSTRCRNLLQTIKTFYKGCVYNNQQIMCEWQCSEHQQLLLDHNHVWIKNLTYTTKRIMTTIQMIVAIPQIDTWTSLTHVIVFMYSQLRTNQQHVVLYVCLPRQRRMHGHCHRWQHLIRLTYNMHFANHIHITYQLTLSILDISKSIIIIHITY